MKKLSNLKWFTLGIVVCLLVTALIVPTFAASLSKTAQLVYSDIKITLNGYTLTPKDANGNTVEPFIIDGTTYLPVRAISNALGLSVEWDGDTKTVKLSDGSTHTEAGTVLMNKNGVKITCLGVESSSSVYGGVDVLLLIENTSSKNYTIYTENESANGYMVETYFACDVAAGKKAYANVNYAKDDLEASNISYVTSLEFIFGVYNTDTGDGDFYSDIIRIN